MTPLWNVSPLLMAAAKGDGPPVTPFAQEIGGWTIFGLVPITNSMIVAVLVTLLLLVVSWLATRNASEVPGRLQNFIESIVEGLEHVMADLLEPKVVRWVFPFIATFFIFILVSNLSGLFPFVGSFGLMATAPESIAVESVDMPFFRPPTADANMTIAMALIFFFACWYWTFKYNGLVGTYHHIFGIKGNITNALQGPLKLVAIIGLGFIFIVVGLLEMVSITIRPVALAARLFGNIYGGENVLTIMLSLIPKEPYGNVLAVLLNSLVALPFYFLELLVATVQTLVFTFLCLAFTATLCSHMDDGDGDHAEEGAPSH